MKDEIGIGMGIGLFLGGALGHFVGWGDLIAFGNMYAGVWLIIPNFAHKLMDV